MKQLTLLSVLTLMASQSIAEETRKAESHEHGVGQLDIAFDGSNIAMELHAPGADIVGFEYKAKSEEDHKAIESAVSSLEDPKKLFALPQEAGCEIVKSSAELEGDDDHHDEHSHDEHEEHKDDHDEHEDHKDNHEEHEDHNDEHETTEGDSHSEFHAEFLFECADPSAVSEITFPYFETFPNAEELELQVVTNKGASAFEVERDAPRVNLEGLL